MVGVGRSCAEVARQLYHRLWADLSVRLSMKEIISLALILALISLDAKSAPKLETRHSIFHYPDLRGRQPSSEPGDGQTGNHHLSWHTNLRGGFVLRDLRDQIVRSHHLCWYLSLSLTGEEMNAMELIYSDIFIVGAGQKQLDLLGLVHWLSLTCCLQLVAPRSFQFQALQRSLAGFGGSPLELAQ